MSKIHNKIIISLLLAVILWSGVNITQHKTLLTFNVAKVQAVIDCTELKAKAQGTGGNSSETAAALRCIQLRVEQEQTPLPTGGWFVFRETLTNMPKVLGEGVVKTVVMVIGTILQLIWIPILGILLRLSATFLDASIQMTLDSNNITRVNDAILIVWSLIRNIFNITFIFILLYTAIKTIIGSVNANTKKMIANVVVSALFINFSLFVTRIIIDIGNILAVTLYTSATGNFTISETMMKLVGVGAIFASTGVDDITSVPFFLISALQVITITTAILTFTYVMFLMLVRNVMLIFLLVLSPIGFMGNVLPKISEYSKMWRENLYGQVFIAPIFLLLFYLITLIGLNLSPENLDSIMGASKEYGQYFKFVLIIALLVAAVKITKKMSGAIGAAMEKYGGLAVGAALGAATGGTALLARQTVGRGAASALSGEKGEALRDAANEGDTGAQRKLRVLEFASKSTFDARNTKTGKLAGKGFDKIGGMAGLSIPSLGKGGGSYSRDGKMTGFAGAQQAEQEKANKAFNDANKGVTGADRVAARDALERRRVAVESNLQGNTAYTTAKGEVRKMEHEGLTTNAKLQAASKEQREAAMDVTTARPDQKGAAEERLKKAKNDYENTKNSLIKENQEKYKDDIAEQNKIIKEETRKAQLNVEGNMKKSTNRQDQDDLKKITRVERARNLAQAMREGKVGIAGIIRSNARNAKIAGGMESQKEKTEAELLREEMHEMRREAREAAKNK